MNLGDSASAVSVAASAQTGMRVAVEKKFQGHAKQFLTVGVLA